MPSGIYERKGIRTDALRNGEAAFRQTFRLNRRSAERRGVEFSLTTEEFRSLAGRVCFYCGVAPSQKTTLYAIPGRRKVVDVFVYNGIDRVDSDRGYELGNVVPCCGVCNRAKGTMSQDMFFGWIRRVALYRAMN